MRQVLFEIPGLGIKVLGFSTMLFLALFGSLQIAVWRAEREKLDPDVFFDLSIWTGACGLIGARVLFVLQHREAMGSIWDAFKIWQGGIVFYGSLIGGSIGFLLCRARRPFPFLPAVDVVATSIAIGVALGRVGCFLNGCCYGDPCNLPIAIRFPAQSIPWLDQVRNGLIPASASWSLPLHPTQIYSVLDGAIILLLLSAFYPLRRRDGEVMALLMVTYPITRFLIELLRNDESIFFAGMTISQNISVLAFLGGLVFWFCLLRQPVGRYVDRVQESALGGPHAPVGRAVAAH